MRYTFGTFIHTECELRSVRMCPMISRNALLFFQDIGGELFGRQMGDVILGIRILAVEVTSVGQQFSSRDTPSAVVFLALFPPCN